MATPPETGKKAPAFTKPINGGSKVSLKEFKGKNVILYFYPKDDTSGCTKEAIGFSAAIKELKKKNAVVLGVSKDSVASHDKFIAKHDLKVNLISDEDGSLTEKYGVWVEKSMYGRKFMGIQRSTFLIDDTGTVRQIWRKVKVADHVQAVLDALDEL